jgi:hypothetical protein
MMKLTVNTTHELSFYDEEIGYGEDFAARIDSDNTVKLRFSTVYDVPGNSGGSSETKWLTRVELERLRKLISRALSIIS